MKEAAVIDERSAALVQAKLVPIADEATSNTSGASTAEIVVAATSRRAPCCRRTTCRRGCRTWVAGCCGRVGDLSQLEQCTERNGRSVRYTSHVHDPEVLRWSTSSTKLDAWSRA
jgi:hypothetical protein